MNFSPGLVTLASRRFLSPPGLALWAVALCIALFLPFAPSAARGANQVSSDVSGGLGRQGVWLCALAFALPWFTTRAAACSRQWRRGDGDWLGTGTCTRGDVGAAYLLGCALALGFVLLPFAVAGEWRAGGAAPALVWLGESDVETVILFKEGDRADLKLHPPSGAQVLMARFIVAAPGSGGPGAQVRARASGPGTADLGAEALISNAAALSMDIPRGLGELSLSFERIGPGAVVALEGRRVLWFGRDPPRWSAPLALYLHAWLACIAVAAVSLAVAAWGSQGTAILAASALLALAWLVDFAPMPWPGVGLRDALDLAGGGFAPSRPTLATWAGCGLAMLCAPAAAALQGDLWRRDS